MVYARKVEGREVTLGVSGRLLDGNLVMWDSESGSLWSQILGEGLHGDEAGTRLDMVPAVFVGLGTWKRMHPETLVLDLSPVQRTAWHYTTEHLASGKNEHDEPLGIGVRAEGESALVPLALLRERRVVPLELGDVPLVVVWHAGEKAALVYERRFRGSILTLAPRSTAEGERLVGGPDASLVFDALSGRLIQDPAVGASVDASASLARHPYIPVVHEAWLTFHSATEVAE